jgi:hypothetical protein
MAKAWLQQRWVVLIPALAALSVDQEEQVAQICADEIAAWKARPSMKSLSSLKEPMTDTRNAIRTQIALTDSNAYVNPRSQEREHIALKYLNYSESEWAEMNRQSEQRYHERLENQQILDRPHEIVAKADALLSSNDWTEVVVGLAVVTGRRLAEILKVGELYPKSRYTVIFSGQLKRKDEILKPYEIPVLVEASHVLAAWSRLRTMIDCSAMETEAIGKAYGTEIGAAAERHFADLVPVRDGREKLFAHLFRAVYPRLAIFYFCPVAVTDIAYVSTILGHYWSAGANEEQQRNYQSSLHYNDYRVGDGAGNIDGRQGTRLGEAGVEVLEVFKPKPVAVGSSKKEQKKVDLLGLEKKKDHSATRLSQETKSRLDQVQQDLKVRTQDEAMSAAIDSHYVLQQIIQLVKPLYEQLGADNPVSAVQALLGEGGAVQVDQRLGEQFQTNLVEVVGVLSDAAAESEKPAEYLRSLLSAKRDFRKSYEKRHQGKDYSTLPLSELRNTKTPGAAQERFKRAADAIIAYNDQAAMPELRWYINAAVVTDLVGGRPSDAKAYLDTRQDVEAHHQKHNLTPGYNRRPISIKERITVPELPEGAAGSAEPEEVTEE